MSISPRETVLKILHNIDNGAYSDAELKSGLRSGLSAEDKRLATELVYGVVCHRTKLDFIISVYSSLPVKRISRWILNILRMGIYQMFFLDRIPDSAAVNESVKLAKRYGHTASVGFVNGVLRTAAAKGQPEYPQDASIIYSHPEWMIDMWKNQFGYPKTQKLLEANNQKAPITLRVNSLKTTAEELVSVLENEGIKAEIETDYCLKIKSFPAIEQSKAYKTGLFTVQDRASMEAVRALDPKSGELVIDVCSAPGGKTTYIAEYMGNNGRVIAFDLHPHKIDIVKKNVQRVGAEIIEVYKQDAQELANEYKGIADRVLADVPCSGLGIIRKKPDIKWTKTIEDIDALVQVQKKILNTAAQYVKKGGRLVYSTCTVSPKENQEQIEEFLNENKKFKPISTTQLLPSVDLCDGFFIGVMECVE